MISSLVIDGHCDTLLKLYQDKTMSFFSGTKIKYHVTRELLEKGGIDVQVFALWVPVKMEKIALDITLNLIAMAKKIADKDNYNFGFRWNNCWSIRS
ncbi:MAG: membrane dipeptidase [Candidatus Hodarchaeales archaeon]